MPQGMAMPYGQMPTGMSGMPGIGLGGHLMDSHAEKQARRLYVGNIPSGQNNESVRQFINTELAAAVPGRVVHGMQPCMSIQIAANGLYAFAEFIGPEWSSTCLEAVRGNLNGQPLKFRRPKDYLQTVDVPSLCSAPNRGTFSGTLENEIPNGPEKIYIGSLDPHVSYEQLKVRYRICYLRTL